MSCQEEQWDEGWKLMDPPDILAVYVWKGEIKVNAQRKSQICKLITLSSCQSKQVYLWYLLPEVQKVQVEDDKRQHTVEEERCGEY